MYVATFRFRFTPVSPDDWQRLDVLFRASVKYGSRNHYTPAQLDAWVRRMTLERWSELLTGNLFFFLAETVDTGEAAGFFSVSSQGYVHSLFVHPRYGGQGLGRQMLAAAERIAVAGGAREMTAEASLTARALFESCGYSVRRKQDVVLDGQVLVNFCVSRPLPTVGVPQTEIRPVWKERKRFLDLLLLGDEQESAIDAYLERGRMYLLTTGGESVGVCVVTDEAEGVCEVKNLAVRPVFQRRGYGRCLLRFAEACCRGYARMMQVGTGESPLTLPFYERCGYKVSHRVPRFFLDHYDHPVYDGGHRLVDMIYLRKPL